MHPHLAAHDCRGLGHDALHDAERRSIGDSLGLCTGCRNQCDESCLGLAAGGAYALLVRSAALGIVVPQNDAVISNLPFERHHLRVQPMLMPYGVRLGLEQRHVVINRDGLGLDTKA